MRRLAMFAMLALLAACGEDEPAGVDPADIDGTWIYSASDLSGPGLTCDISGVTATVNQSGSTFTGTVAGGTATCVTPAGTVEQALTTGTITNGVINGNSVSFDIDNLDSQHLGTVAGNTMTGTVSLSLDTALGPIQFTGDWTATRQP